MKNKSFKAKWRREWERRLVFELSERLGVYVMRRTAGQELKIVDYLTEREARERLPQGLREELAEGLPGRKIERMLSEEELKRVLGIPTDGGSARGAKTERREK